jgi:ABC-type multidrug transport system permease subunit
MLIKMSKIGFFIAAGASFVFSVSLWFYGSREEGLFVGLWVPSILSFATLLYSGGKRNE